MPGYACSTTSPALEVNARSAVVSAVSGVGSEVVPAVFGVGSAVVPSVLKVGSAVVPGVLGWREGARFCEGARVAAVWRRVRRSGGR